MTAMIVVSAANARNRKNIAPQTTPPVMRAKTSGSATKMSPGPCV